MPARLRALIKCVWVAGCWQHQGVCLWVSDTLTVPGVGVEIVEVETFERVGVGNAGWVLEIIGDSVGGCLKWSVEGDWWLELCEWVCHTSVLNRRASSCWKCWVCKWVSETGNGCPVQMSVKQRKVKLFRVLMFEFVRGASQKALWVQRRKTLCLWLVSLKSLNVEVRVRIALAECAGDCTNKCCQIALARQLSTRSLVECVGDCTNECCQTALADCVTRPLYRGQYFSQPVST